MYKHFFKRFLDFWISLILLVCISPVLIIITVWLHFANKGAGAFFFQERPGKNGKIFKMFKFRSMIVNAPDLRMEDGSTYNAEDDPRVTKVGRFLRKTLSSLNARSDRPQIR